MIHRFKFINISNCYSDGTGRNFLKKSSMCLSRYKEDSPKLYPISRL